MRAENQRVASDKPASKPASPAMISAMRTICPAEPDSREIRLMMSPASSGVITPITDEPTTSARKNVISRQYGRAMPMMRRTMPFGSSRAVTDGSRRNDLMAAMEVMGLDTARPPLLLRCGQRGPSGNCSTPEEEGSPTGREFPQPADLGGALFRVLGVVV